MLVLDLLSGADLAPAGVLWALIAMVCAASYFVLAAKPRPGLPPVALAGAGLATGALVLAALGAVGILPMHATTASPVYADSAVAWWLPLLGLGVVTAGFAYCTGIAASRRLGSRLASFVALLEVVAGVTFAWLLLDQLPGAAPARRRRADRRRRGRRQARRGFAGVAARAAAHRRPRDDLARFLRGVRGVKPS